jgi:hypothetical protein
MVIVAQASLGIVVLARQYSDEFFGDEVKFSKNKRKSDLSWYR